MQRVLSTMTRQHLIEGVTTLFLLICAVASHYFLYPSMGQATQFNLLYLLPVIYLTYRLGFHWGAGMALAGWLAWIVTAFVLAPAELKTIGGLWQAIQLFIILFLTTTLINAARRHLNFVNRPQRDPLTSLPVRSEYMHQINQELTRSRRYNRPFSIIQLNVDNFRPFNESYGYRAGDQLLALMSHTVLECTRSTDAVARTGIDDFSILIPETRQAQAKEIAERLMERLQQIADNQHWPVTFTIAIATYNTLPPNADSVVRFNERLMQKAKATGKNIIKSESYTAKNSDNWESRYIRRS